MRHLTRRPTLVTCLVLPLVLVGAPATIADPGPDAVDLPAPSRTVPVSADMATASGHVTAFVALDTESAVDVAGDGGDRAEVRAARAETEAVAAEVVPAKATPRSAGTAEPQRIATVTNLVPGTLVVGDAEQIRALTADDKVVGIRRVVPKTVTTVPSADAVTRAVDTWVSTGATGRDVTVGIVDTGVDYTHADFGGAGTRAYDAAYGADGGGSVADDAYDHDKFYPGVGYDFAGRDYDPYHGNVVPAPDNNPIDSRDNGHGTHVAGIAAGYGVTADSAAFAGSYASLTDTDDFLVDPGAAPEARLVALKVFGDDGVGTELVSLALDWAADPNRDGDFSDRLDVVNLSLSGDFGAADDPDSLVADRLAELGTVVVAAAGNSGDVEDADGTPSNADNVISVAATDFDDDVAPFSSRGGHGSIGSAAKPDVAAPGVEVVSAWPGATSGVLSGTSMAAPHVAGIAALVRQQHTGWSTAQVKAAVVNTATHDVADLATGQVHGPARVGSGRVDAHAAVTTDLLAFSTEAPAATSVSFGVVDVGADTVTTTKQVTVQNTGPAAATLDATFVPSTTAGGATVAVSPATATVAAGGQTTLTLTLTADPSTLSRDLDPTQDAQVGGIDRDRLSRLTGRLTIVSGDTELRVPVQAVPRPTSDLSADPQGLVFTDASTGTLTVDGRPLGANDWSSFATPLILAGTSPQHDPLTDDQAQQTSASTVAAGDIQYVGWGSTAPAAAAAGRDPSDGFLTIGISTYGEWATLGVMLQPAVWLDVDGDGAPEYITYAEKLPGADGYQEVTVATTYKVDRLMDVLVPVGSVSVNEYAGDQNSGVFDGSTVLIPVPLSLVPRGSTPQVTVKTESAYGDDEWVIDSTGPFTVDPYDPPVWFESNDGLRLTSRVVGPTDITAHLGGTAVRDTRLLVLYPQNDGPAKRAQLLDMLAPGETPPVVDDPSDPVSPSNPGSQPARAGSWAGRNRRPGPVATGSSLSAGPSTCRAPCWGRLVV